MESIIRDLVDLAIGLVRGEMIEQVKEPAEKQVEQRLLDYLLPSADMQSIGTIDDEAAEKRKRTREKMLEQLRAGELEDRSIEIAVEERGNVVGVLGQAGMEMDIEFQTMFEKMLPTRRETRRLTVAEARKVLLQQEADKLIDRNKITDEAIKRG